MAKMTKAQVKALGELTAVHNDLWHHLQGLHMNTIRALERRKLIDIAENAVTGNTFYRITEAGRRALALAGEV